MAYVKKKKVTSTVKSPNKYPNKVGGLTFKSDGRFTPSEAWLNEKEKTV